jgi:hypothetical protein
VINSYLAFSPLHFFSMGFKNWWNALAFLRDLRANYSQDMARLGGMIRAVSSQHHVDVIALNARIDQLDKLVKDRTDIAVDFGYKDPSCVIVVGRCRRAPLAVHLVDEQLHGVPLDAPPMVRAVFERDVHAL